MELTDEQMAALAFFRLGMTLRLEARAGAGKTSTLREMAASTRRPGQLVAFNKAVIADAAKVMPGHVACSTMHSLAWRHVGRNYAHRIESPRKRSADIARLLGLGHLTIRYGSQTKVLQPGFLASLAMRSVNAFCQTDAERPGPEHIPYLDGIDEPVGEFGRGMANNLLVHEHIGPCLERAWADLQDPDGKLSYSHAAYLKQWERGEPRIGGDFILVDEAQDQSGVMLSILLRQAAQLVAVGDTCQPAGTEVAVVVGFEEGRARRAIHESRPIERIRVGDRVVSYGIAKGHLYRGGQTVVAVRERPYAGVMIDVKCGPHATSYTPEHPCVVRLADCFDGRHAVYVMRRGSSFRVGRAAGRYGLACGAALRATAERADAMWIVDLYDSAQEAAVAEASIAWRFGVPTLTFEFGGGKLGVAGLARFWRDAGDLSEQAAALLAHHGRDVRFPLWEPSMRHMLFRGPLVVRACNLLPGMRMMALDAFERRPSNSNAWKGHAPVHCWQPIDVTRHEERGFVYSLEVAGAHTYFGDGLLTHNCQQLYEWLGAHNALQKIPTEATAYLTRSWRFGPAIAEVANAVLRELGADPLVEGCDVASSVERIDGEPDALLCRSNAEAVRRVLGYQRDGVKVHLVGNAGAQVVAFAEAAERLETGVGTTHPELACFDSWREVLAYVEQDPSGGELALLVGLVQEFGPEVIIDALAGMPGEEAAQLVVSTAHQSKGREWGRVRLASDFQEPEGPGAAGEWRLLYVAATRAQHVLDLAECEPLMTLLDGPAQQTLSMPAAPPPSP